MLSLYYQNGSFYVLGVKFCCRANVVRENGNNNSNQSFCVPDYYRVHVSTFHMACQLTCVGIPCEHEPKFDIIKFAERFPNNLRNMQHIDYCWYDSIPELHRIAIEIFELEFDPYKYHYGVYQEICILNNPLFSEALYGLINCSVCHMHLQSFLVVMTIWPRIT